MDFVIRGATVVTMDPERRVLPDCDVVVRDGRIAAIGEETPAGMPSLPALGKVLVPGFVQAHVHLCQTLFRNQADGLPLLEWLSQRIWPLEAAHDERSMAASARLGIAELIRSGTTAILDMGSVRHTDAIFEVAEESGFRMTGGKAQMDAGEGALGESTEASLREAEELCRRWNGAAEGRLAYAFAPRFLLSCTSGLVRETAQLARGLGARLHTHASENRQEGELVRERFGADNIEALHEHGFTGPDVALAHCVWPNENELGLLASTGTHVVHCPSSNLKLGSGIAPIPELLQRGASLALGADGAPCNNNLDAFEEMRLAALLHKPRCGASAMSARQVLELATLGGARALGREAEIGSIEVGKQADLVLLDLDRPHAVPFGDDLHGAIVHAARAGDVTDAWIAGRQVLRARNLVTLDEERVLFEAKAEARRVASRAFG